MRVIQRTDSAGSLKWLQRTVKHSSDLITAHLPIKKSELVSFRSPVQEDAYAEYSDADFLQRLGINELDVPLSRFWPSGGPHFDGLIRAGDKIFLVEAKAHVAELFSHCAAKDPKSKLLIETSLNAAKKFYHARPDANWLSPFYQYCNRLAHLYFLREVNGLDAHLACVYFLNDTAQGKVCPKTVPGWEKALMVLHEAIGMTGRLPKAVHNVYVDVEEVPPA